MCQSTLHQLIFLQGHCHTLLPSQWSQDIKCVIGTGTVNRETFKCNSRYNWKTRHFIHNRQYPSKQTSEQDFDFFFQQQSVSDLVSCYAYTQVAEAHLSAVFFLRLIPVFSPCGSNAQPSPLCISCQGSCAGLRLLT